MAAIRGGNANRSGDRYEVNGRFYGMEPTGRMFPISGDGLVQLDRREFKALTLLIKYGGRTVDAERQILRDPAMTESVIAKALELFKRREEG